MPVKSQVIRISNIWASLFVVSILSACAQGTLVVTEAPAPATQLGGTCNLADVQFVLGKTVDERLAEEARRRAGARVVRILRPGQIATLEFNPSRLNLRVDRLGLVTDTDCG